MKMWGREAVPLGFDTPSVFCFAKSTSPATQGHSGWNKVALLTAVRNSPCSCPFSVSLHRPQDALNSEPRCIARWARSARIPRTRGQLLGGVTASLPCRGRWMRVQRAAVGNKKRSTSEYLDKASNDVPETYVQDVQQSHASVITMPQISFECQAVLSFSITGRQ